MHMTNIHAAKSHFSQLIELVAQGEEVIICKSGKPVVRLVKYQENEQPRVPGCWKGKVQISEDFDELPSAFHSAFRGEGN